MVDCFMSPIGWVKEIGKSIITHCLWPPVKRHIDYWWCFDDNIQGLRDEVLYLDRETYGINQKIEEARLGIKKLRPGVEDWAKAGTEKVAEARRILPDNRIPQALPDNRIPQAWNLISRYSMGKKAKKTAEEIAKLRNDGKFNAIADPPPPPSMGSPSHRQIMEFISRKRIEEEIVKSLTSSSVGMIGICGMGGVGKTTMVKSITKRVKEEKLFDEVVMVVVSQKVDMHKIQKEIAELLGLKFDWESITARADQLCARLKDKNRKLIILDDVWEILKFADLGIPFESERCKVLLTSRSRGACKGVEKRNLFELEILKDDEAWILFKEKAGECVEQPALLSVAKQVVAQCKGLPIALVTVGMTLKDEMNKHRWKDSLSQLERSNPLDFPELLTDVYKPLKLSYDYLILESEKLLFLLCCLFPEDHEIPVKELTFYSMGLQIFNDMRSIQDARNRTHGLIETLKSRFLLIDGENKLHVRMHDVVRDVAIYIGSKDKEGFLKIVNETSITSSSDVSCSWMSVDISVERRMGFCFPKLRLLMETGWRFNELSDISFEGMNDLNVLRLSRSLLVSIPPTLGLLKNLTTLYLYYCAVENISVIGELAGLEILYCYRCYMIKELPSDIGRLNCLRLMEVDECFNLQRIPFGVISSLVGLEELKIHGSYSQSFREWEIGGEKGNAAVTELGFLPNLTCLEIEMDDWNLASQDIRLSRNLVRYCIRIASYGYLTKPEDYEKVMILKLPSHIGAVGNWIKMLVRNTEYLYLEGDCPSNINLAEIENLRNLSVRNCSTWKRLVETKDCKFRIVFPLLESLTLNALEILEELCEPTISLNSLCNLKSISISSCSKLRYLFLVSVARRCLLQLEDLKIENCDAMEQVFWNEIKDNTDDFIEFPKFSNLKSISISSCSNLRSLVSMSVVRRCLLQLEDLEIEDCYAMEEVFWNEIKADTDDCIEFPMFCNLKFIRLRNCIKLRYLSLASVARESFLQLEFLVIQNCLAMEQVFWSEITDDTFGCVEFPKLKKLDLDNLPNLTAFCPGFENINFPNMTDMYIGDLPKLNSLCPLNSEQLHDHTSFHFLCNPKVEMGTLHTLRVSDLGDNIRNIWCHQIPFNFFNNLRELRIYNIHGIRSLMSYPIAKNLVSLRSLDITYCKEMVEVIEGDDKQVVDIHSLFLNLIYLSFKSLHKLRRFWQWNHALELPLLEKVDIAICSLMETFTMGSINTPNIREININYKEIYDQKDLNDAIRHIWIESRDTSKNEEDKDDDNYNDENKDEKQQ